MSETTTNAASPNATTQWVDLSAHGLTLAVCEVDGIRLVGATGTPDDAGRVGLEALGFVAATDDLWVREGDRVDFTPILEAFPQSRLVDVPLDVFAESFVIRFGGGQVATPAAPTRTTEEQRRAREARKVERKRTLDGLLANSRRLGMNHLSQEVWAFDGGEGGKDRRFVLQKEGKGDFSILAEGTGMNVNPGLFMRATTPATAAMAADGFVEAMVDGGVRRFDDLRRLAGAMFGDGTALPANDVRLLQTDALVETAMARWLGRRNSRSLSELFQLAQRFQEARAYRTDLARHVPVEVRPLPVPVAIAMQRIAGTEGELRGKDVVVLGSAILSAFVPAVARVTAWSRDVVAQASVLTASRRASSAMETPEVKEGTFAILSAPQRETGDPIEVDGVTYRRRDIADAARALLLRAPEGRMVLALEAARDPAEEAEITAFRTWVARGYAIEGTARLSGVLGTADPAQGVAGGHMVVAIGVRRPEPLAEPPEVALHVTDVANFGDMWSWTSSVAVSRSLIDGYHTGEVEATGVPEAERPQVNRFQSPYVSLSGLGTASTMVPRNLEAATREAQELIRAAHPDFDGWLCSRIGMTRDQAEAALSPEQADAIGMVLHAWERGRGALIGDMTGLGKGRAMAALAKAAILEGKKVMILTEKALGFHELARDFVDIGAWDDLSPFIMNAGVDIRDENAIRPEGTQAPLLMTSADRRIIDNITTSGEWPKGVNVVFATYSQFNRPGVEKKRKRAAKPKAKVNGPDAVEDNDDETPEVAPLLDLDDALGLDVPDVAGINTVMLGDDEAENDAEAPGDNVEDNEDEATPVGLPEGVSPKSWWLRHAIDKDTVLILDESHNAAASKSNSGANIAAAVAAAGDVVFSSATHAKNARTMEVYAKLFPPDFDISNITEIINRGGDDMHSILTNMFVKDGVMISRQHDLSNCHFEAAFDDKHSERNKDYLARLAPILSEMSYMSGDISRRINTINTRTEMELLAKYKNNENLVKSKMNKGAGLRTMAFGSPLYQVKKLCVASLLVDCTVDGMIKALEENRKPMVFTESTVQGLMQDIQAEDGDSRMPDFRDLMLRVLGQLCKVTKAGKKKGESVEVEDPFLPTPVETMSNRLAESIQERMSEALLADADPEELLPPELGEGGRVLTDVERSPWKVEMFAAAIASANAMALADGIDAASQDDPRADMLREALLENQQLIENLSPIRSENVGILRTFAAHLPPTPARYRTRIETMIRLLPDLSASAIDEICQRIEAEGRRRFENGEIDRPWKMGEMTGRTLCVRDGLIVPRVKIDKQEVRNQFNNGDIDGLIMNAAGATSVSLHAGIRCRDQRQREMWMLMQHSDIAKFIQAIGRIYRFDQVIGPRIITPMLDMPVQEYLLAVQNVKLSRLSANMQSSKEHPAATEGIADLMNRVGDKVVVAYADDHPDLMKRMALDFGELAESDKPEDTQRDSDSRDKDFIAHKFFSRLIMVDPDWQVRALSEVKSSYKATLQEYTDRGENPLETQVVNGTVTIRKEEIYAGADSEGTGSVFYEPVRLLYAKVEHTQDPLRSGDIGMHWDSGMTSFVMDGLHDLPQRLAEQREGYVRKLLMPGQTEQQAVLLGSVTAGLIRRYDNLAAILPKCVPGMVVGMQHEGMPVEGVILSVSIPKPDEKEEERFFKSGRVKPKMEFMASNYEVYLAWPGSFAPTKRRLSNIMSDKDFTFIGHLRDEVAGMPPVDADVVMSTFDNALEGNRVDHRMMLVGNDWAAMQAMMDHNLGYPVVYRDENGDRQRAVMIRKKAEAMDFLPIRMAGHDKGLTMTCELLQAGKVKLHGLRTLGGKKDISGKSTGGMMVVWAKKAKKVKISLPMVSSKEHGWIRQIPAVRELVKRLAVVDPGNTDKFHTLDARDVIYLSADDAREVLRVFVDNGVAFYAPPACSKDVAEWRQNRAAKGQEDTPEVDDPKADGQEPDDEADVELVPDEDLEDPMAQLVA